MFRRAVSIAQPRFAASISAPMLVTARRFMTPPEAFQALQIAKVGEPAPNFSATAYNPDGSFSEKVGLTTFEGKKLVILFYPLDFTFVCPTEILGFSDRADEFAKLNAAVVAVSVDSHFSHRAWAQMPRKKGGLEGIKIPLIADMTKDISRDYGVLIEDKGIALRGLFILDEEHVLQSATVNNLSIGRSVDEALRVCQAIQEARDGNVVPCGWTPGKPLLKVAKAAEFFEKNN